MTENTGKMPTGRGLPAIRQLHQNNQPFQNKLHELLKQIQSNTDKQKHFDARLYTQGKEREPQHSKVLLKSMNTRSRPNLNHQNNMQKSGAKKIISTFRTNQDSYFKKSKENLNVGLEGDCQGMVRVNARVMEVEGREGNGQEGGYQLEQNPLQQGLDYFWSQHTIAGVSMKCLQLDGD